jgi:hypothetical protein
MSERDYAIVDNFIDSTIPEYLAKDNPDIAKVRRAWGRILLKSLKN